MKLKPITPPPINKLVNDKIYHIKESISRHSIQYLVNSMIKTSYSSIKNELKLPDFVRFYSNYEVKYSKLSESNINISRAYKYVNKPPSLNDIFEDANKLGEKVELMKRDSKNAEAYSYISPIKVISSKIMIIKIKLGKNSD